MHAMPIYEYRCEACRNRFEVLTSFQGREHEQVCPVCSSVRTQVQVSTFAAHGFSEPGSGDFAADMGPGGGGCSCGGSCSCSN